MINYYFFFELLLNMIQWVNANKHYSVHDFFLKMVNNNKIKNSKTVEEPWSTGWGGSSDETRSNVAQSTSSCPGSSPDTENALCGQSSGTFSAAVTSRNVETKVDVETNTWRVEKKEVSAFIMHSRTLISGDMKMHFNMEPYNSDTGHKLFY